MLSIFGNSGKLCDGVSRRELLQIGGLSALGLSLPTLLNRRAEASTARGPMFGRAKNVIFLWLQGGPPQHETFDPKPNAPAEIRGEFQPIDTNVPGIQFCELLPRTARIADKLAVVRSISTDNHIHSASGYHVLTGYKYQGPNARQISPNDWPYFGSIVKQRRPSEQMPAYSTVWLPDIYRLNENVQPAGQTAGFLGKRWNPERMIFDPSDPTSLVDAFRLQADVPPDRFADRRSLLDAVDKSFATAEQSGVLDLYSRQVQEAFGILSNGRAREAFDVRHEPEALRERYGRCKWGQCVLLARRLVEAGVRLVHVNWTREEGDSAVDNPMWDTHAQNADRVQYALCPQFDVGFSALIEDLDDRGLLSETLVVAIGEFGRTPKINSSGGRDHWGSVFSFAMAGAGIQTAQAYGSSDKIGAFPDADRVEPQDLTATIFHLLGIEHDSVFYDALDRPHPITTGSPIWGIVGDRPKTEDRCPSTGNLAMVPPYSEDRLLNTQFDQEIPLIPVDATGRLKGWRATPIVDLEHRGFGVQIVGKNDSHHAGIGQFPAESSESDSSVQIAALGQEILNARAGHYAFRVRASGFGESKEAFEDFASTSTCRLVLFRYAEAVKDPTKRHELASMVFQPAFGKTEEFILEKRLDSDRPGANFSIGKGLGVAIVVERNAAPESAPAGPVYVQIDEAWLEFGGRTRNDEVQV